MKKIARGVKRKWNHSIVGLKIAFKEEKSFLFYLIFFGVVLALGIYAKLSYLQWISIVTIFTLSIAIEIINTSLEATVDMISFQYNVKVKKIKDIASASSLIMGVGDFVVVVLIFVSAFTGVL